MWLPPGAGLVKSDRQENCIRHPDQIAVLGIVRGWTKLKPEDKALTKPVEGSLTLTPQETKIVDKLVDKLRLRPPIITSTNYKVFKNATSKQSANNSQNPTTNKSGFVTRGLSSKPTKPSKPVTLGLPGKQMNPSKPVTLGNR